MQSPLAQLFLHAQREADPIYFVYSQPSIQVDWLLESTADGATWPRRFSSFEANHNQLARRRGAWMKLCQDLGYTPQFVPADELPEVSRHVPRNAVIVLADALALSDWQASTLTAIARSGCHLLGNGPIAAFDEHGRLRAEPSRLDAAVTKPAADISSYTAERLRGAEAEWFAWAAKQLPLARRVTVPPETHTRVHRYRRGEAQLVAFERNIVYHMSEDLKQTGGNEALEQPVVIEARLDAPAHVYDLRAQRYLGRVDRVSFTLDGWQPSLFALLPEKLPSSDEIVRQLLARR
jgi:hypothetical protein